MRASQRIVVPEPVARPLGMVAQRDMYLTGMPARATPRSAIPVDDMRRPPGLVFVPETHTTERSNAYIDLHMVPRLVSKRSAERGELVVAARKSRKREWHMLGERGSPAHPESGEREAFFTLRSLFLRVVSSAHDRGTACGACIGGRRGVGRMSEAGPGGSSVPHAAASPTQRKH